MYVPGKRVSLYNETDPDKKHFLIGIYLAFAIVHKYSGLAHLKHELPVES